MSAFKFFNNYSRIHKLFQWSTCIVLNNGWIIADLQFSDMHIFSKIKQGYKNQIYPDHPPEEICQESRDQAKTMLYM